MKLPPNPPPLGDRDLSVRACTRDTQWPQGVICNAEPFLHVDWGQVAGFVCGRHAAELVERNWIPVQTHEVGSDCGMPEAVWDAEQNRCYVPQEDSEAGEELRVLAAVPAHSRIEGGGG